MVIGSLGEPKKPNFLGEVVSDGKIIVVGSGHDSSKGGLGKGRIFFGVGFSIVVGE